MSSPYLPDEVRKRLGVNDSYFETLPKCGYCGGYGSDARPDKNGNTGAPEQLPCDACWGSGIDWTDILMPIEKGESER